ncbi:hypothetical protein [Streptomyces sp. 5-6(2022)]|uniref:hypothetical protein n=1 Tax=Streptomyces sp. 5-6(2022) TaxID=2936510 RepID=UPI0023B98E68|nr:hypothetical protein [Streptomyces sp. 5-6(2022)]
MTSTVSDLADAIRLQAVTAGATEPTVRGADWQTAIVTAVGTGTVDCGTITARRLESYQNPAVGDRIVITQSGNGNWLACGRTVGATEQAFLTYTPTWTADTTNPSLGNGSLVGRYWRYGTNVVGSINLTVGSSTTLGSGNYFWQLPTNAGPNGLIAIGSAQVLIAGGNRWPGQTVISPSDTNRVGVYMPTAAANSAIRRLSAANGSPDGALATNAQVRISFQYESA